MSSEGRVRKPSRAQAFRGEVQADPHEERDGVPTAFAMAIAEAALDAASTLDASDGPQDFEVSRIQITVSPNPGPTSYKVTITPSG